MGDWAMAWSFWIKAAGVVARLTHGASQPILRLTPYRLMAGASGAADPADQRWSRFHPTSTARPRAKITNNRLNDPVVARSSSPRFGASDTRTPYRRSVGGLWR